MSSPRLIPTEAPLARAHDDVASSSTRASTLDENAHAIKRGEQGSPG